MKAGAWLCLGIGVLGHVYADALWLRRLNTAPAGPPVGEVHPWPGPVASALTVVLVDGLRHDVAATLPGLRGLAGQGVFRVLQADYPSFTYASLTTVVTGVPPAESGVRLNAALPALALDSVSLRAEAAGLPVRYAGTGIPALGELLRVGSSATEVPIAELLATPAPGLSWLYLDGVDRAGHHGGAASSGYRDAAATADATVARLARRMDLRREALVVLSDHGHRDVGGHGGVEPEVLAAFFLAAGPGVSPGSPGPAPMRAVAPTLCGWLGVAPPGSARSAPLGDLVGGEAPPTPAAPDVARWAGLPLGVPLALARARDALPVLVALGVSLAAMGLRGYRWSWSVPRGELGFTLESLLASALGLLIAARWMRRERRAAEATLAALVLGPPFGLCALVAGPPSALAPPAVGFGVVAWGTLALWIGVPMGLRGVLR